MRKSIETSISGFSHLLIQKFLDNLSYEEIVYVVKNVSDFYRNRILRLLSPDISQLVELEVDSSFSFEDDIENNIIIKIDNYSEIETYNCVYNEDKDYIDNLKYIASRILFNDEINNLRNLCKLLISMCSIARKEGLLALDFIFLREDGLKEDLFCWLLIEVTSGIHLDEVISKSEILSDSSLNSEYKEILLIGLRHIQSGENCNVLSEYFGSQPSLSESTTTQMKTGQ